MVIIKKLLKNFSHIDRRKFFMLVCEYKEGANKTAINIYIRNK